MPLPAVQERSVWGDDKMANAPELSLRGGRRPTWQSHATGYVFAGSTLLSDRVLRDSHVASLLGMTNLGALCGRRCHPITCKPARRSGSAASGLQKSPRPGGLGDPFFAFELKWHTGSYRAGNRSRGGPAAPCACPARRYGRGRAQGLGRSRRWWTGDGR